MRSKGNCWLREYVLLLGRSRNWRRWAWWVSAGARRAGRLSSCMCWLAVRRGALRHLETFCVTLLACYTSCISDSPRSDVRISCWRATVRPHELRSLLHCRTALLALNILLRTLLAVSSLFICLLPSLLTYLCNYLLTYVLIYLLTYVLIYLLTYVLTYLLAYLCTYLFTNLLM
jgi:hypothetical protein